MKTSKVVALWSDYQNENNKYFYQSLNKDANWSWNKIFCNSRYFCQFFLQKVRIFSLSRKLHPRKWSSLLAKSRKLREFWSAKREFLFSKVEFHGKEEILTFWRKNWQKYLELQKFLFHDQLALINCSFILILFCLSQTYIY